MAFDNSLLLFSNLNRLLTLFTLADFERDLATMDENGFIKIIGRIKVFFVLIYGWKKNFYFEFSFTNTE